METGRWVISKLGLIWQIRWTRNQILTPMDSCNLLILQSLLIYSCNNGFIYNCFLYTLPFIVSLDSCCCFTFLRCYFVYFLPYIVNKNCFKNKRKKRPAQFYF